MRESEGGVLGSAKGAAVQPGGSRTLGVSLYAPSDGRDPGGGEGCPRPEVTMGRPASLWKARGMDLLLEGLTAGAAVLSLVVAAIATRQARNSADAATEQVKLQRQMNIEAAQPYVWVDIRPRESDGELVQLVVGNSGPTVATNVRVTVDRDIPHSAQKDELLVAALDRFNKGHASLPPGRVLRWNLGVGHELLGDASEDMLCHVKVNACGPAGPIPELSYGIDMNDWRGTAVHREGSLWRVEKSITDLGKTMERIERSARAQDSRD